jgi:threonine dehydrogenase-like Zn-dependent dehydrogenase
MTFDAKALFYTSPGKAEIRTVALGSADMQGEPCRIRTLWSGISRGTERLVFSGRLPESEWQRMRAPFQEGDFPFPVKYGYCNVGEVEEGPCGLKGRTVFSLHPHQDQFTVPAGAVVPLPDGVPPRRAILAANMETALNVLWDSGAGAGDRIAIVGGGVLGLLIAFLAAGLPGAEVAVIDPLAERREVAVAFGAQFASPEEAVGVTGDADVVIHASASEEGIRLALALAGFEAKIIEASWFGDLRVGLDLGQAFHSRRLQLVSSQVGHVAFPRRARWNHRRRLEKALSLLRDAQLDKLITREVVFDDLPHTLPEILGAAPSGLMTAVRYQNQKRSTHVRR